MKFQLEIEHQKSALHSLFIICGIGIFRVLKEGSSLACKSELDICVAIAPSFNPVDLIGV